MRPPDTTFQELEAAVEPRVPLDDDEDHVPPLLEGGCQIPPAIVFGAAVLPISENVSPMSGP